MTPFELAAALKAARVNASVNRKIVSVALEPKAAVTIGASPAGQQTAVGVIKDRHKPGYMAEYMRKRRAKK